MVNLRFKYEKLVERIIAEAPFEPDIALILGSGLGEFANSVETVKSISTNDIPGYPKSTVEGHKGFIHFSNYENKKLIIFQGRIHFYEGYPLSDCIAPVHIAFNLGCDKLIITNAAGGINPNFQSGDLMLISSFNAINLKKELTGLLGIPSVEQKNKLVDFPSHEINEAIREASLEENIYLREGVYMFSKGPSYETPAEVKLAAVSGADAVGMSTVHEAVYASTLGMKISAISCITNMAAGISPVKLTHAEVMETADRVKSKFERLIKRTIQKL